MNLRWIVGNFADPEFKLTRTQQREVTRLAHRKHLRGRTLTMWTLGMALAGWLFVGFGWEPLAGVFASVGLQPARVISGVVIVIGVSLAAAWLYRYIYVTPVRMAMRDLGYDICIGCGHRLQGLPESSDKCPECGESREPLPRTNLDHSASPRGDART